MMRVDINREAENAFEYLRSVCPHASGNMRDTMTLRQTGVLFSRFTKKTTYKIKIGGAKAPYAVYTNEKWIAERWHDRKNPNEKWIDKAVIAIVSDISARYRGKVTSAGDIDRWDNRRYRERMSRR